MKKAEIEIGGRYVAKVSGQLTVVRIDSECQYGGWNATNIKTGRQVRIRTAARLRREAVPLARPAPRADTMTSFMDRCVDQRQ